VNTLSRTKRKPDRSIAHFRRERSFAKKENREQLLGESRAPIAKPIGNATHGHRTGMRKRVESLEGELRISSNPGGTCVRALIPPARARHGA
jgi:hypothetical protein